MGDLQRFYGGLGCGGSGPGGMFCQSGLVAGARDHGEFAVGTFAQVNAAAEVDAGSDGPRYGGDVERQLLGNLVKERQRVKAFSVHLIDERDDRDVA